MIKCPECHGEGWDIEPILWDGFGGGPRVFCELCEGDGIVTQKLRMEWVRRFKKDFGRDDVD